MKQVTTVAVVLLLLAGSMSGQAPRRALTIEDYYRVKTIGDVSISPDGQWVAFTQSTRIEEDNTTSIETYVTKVDGSGARRITHGGADVASPRWTDDHWLSYSLNARVASAVFIGAGGPAASPALRPNAGRFSVAVDAPGAEPRPAAPGVPGVMSADGTSIAQAKDGPRAAADQPAATEFEQRHLTRFKGRTFDWMRFQQDGQDYPTADPRLRPAAEITLTPVGGGAETQVTNLGMRPANLAWHPNGSRLAFTADETWRN